MFCSCSKLGSLLVQESVKKMKELGADEIVLETETSNTKALRLYENLGFLKDKRLARYYLNGNDAFRLKVCSKYKSNPCFSIVKGSFVLSIPNLKRSSMSKVKVPNLTTYFSIGSVG
jgi:hypothetical protein